MSPMSLSRRSWLGLVAIAATTVLADACSSGDSGDSGARTIEGHTYDLSPQQSGRVRAQRVDEIAATVPQAVRARGTLVVTGDSGTAPPLRFYATDDHTVIGSEVDFAYLVADILGLRPEVRVADWSQNFVSIDAGTVDAFVSNVTVTEERKEKYDFATYRLDTIALELPKDSAWTYTDRKSLAGKRIGVRSGTNQEQLLVQWSGQNKDAGLAPVDIAYYQQTSDYYLALASRRIDGYLGPNPQAVYHAATAGQTKVVSTFSGAGDALQAEIAVLTKKDNGLVGPVHAALQYAIDHGSYQRVLDRWNLRTEAVAQSRINPPGLPKKAV